MADVTVTLSLQEVFNNKKLFSEKIHARVQKVSGEISKALDNLKIVNDEEKRLFLNAVNYYYDDLCAVVFHLRKIVIQIDSDDQGVRDLKNVITELNKIIVLVQDCLNMEMGKFIIQLKGTIVHVGSQVEKLMEVVKYDNLHEHKQKVLDAQNDLVIAAEALKLHCLLYHLNPSEFEKIINEIIDKIKNNLTEINTGHDHLVEDFSHYTRHSFQHLQNAVNYLRKMINTQDLQSDIANSFKSILEVSIVFFRAVTEAAYSDAPMVNMFAVLENKKAIVSDGTDKIKKGLQVVTEKNIAKKETEREKQLIIYLYVNAINSMSALNQSIEDAIMKI